MRGVGTKLRCDKCGKEWELDELGYMRALEGKTEFPHIPDWYDWERECVRREIENGEYSLEADVDIYMLVNEKGIYKVGEGTLSHTTEGFSLVGCDGQLSYKQSSKATYSVNSDFYWYKLGDVIGIGDGKALYYCFPKNREGIVAKTRLAAEEIYKIIKR